MKLNATASQAQTAYPSPAKAAGPQNLNLGKILKASVVGALALGTGHVNGHNNLRGNAETGHLEGNNHRNLAETSQSAGKVWSLKLDSEGPLQEVSTAILSDCASLFGGTDWKTAVSQSVLDTFSDLNLEVVSQSQYDPPAPLGLETFKGYSLAENDGWPVSRVGVKGSNDTLVNEVTTQLKTNLNENQKFQDAKGKCDLATTLGVTIPIGLVAVTLAAACIVDRYR